MKRRRSRQMKRSPTQHGRRDVAETADGIAPTTVVVLVRYEPTDAADYERVDGAVCGACLPHKGESADGGGGGQGGGGQLADPIAFGRAFGEERGQRGLISGFQTADIEGVHLLWTPLKPHCRTKGLLLD
jgi:hypothetical protein